VAAGCMNGLGRVSFLGLRRLASDTWVFVVMLSQIGVLSSPALVLSSASSSRFFFSDFAAFLDVVVATCLRRVFEAFNTYYGVSKWLVWEILQ